METCLSFSLATKCLNQLYTSYKSDLVYVGYVTKVICGLREENEAVDMQGT